MAQFIRQKLKKKTHLTFKAILQGKELILEFSNRNTAKNCSPPLELSWLRAPFRNPLVCQTISIDLRLILITLNYV